MEEQTQLYDQFQLQAERDLFPLDGVFVLERGITPGVGRERTLLMKDTWVG